jgi:carboxylesterase type B
LQQNFDTLPLLNTKSLPLVEINSINDYRFTPYVDGKVVPVQPSTAGVNVPAIFGSTLQEGNLFALLQFASAADGPYSATTQDYETFLTENFGSAAPLVEQYYPITAFNASPFPAFTAISDVFTESSVLCQLYRGANVAVSKGIPVWIYLFSHAPSCDWETLLPPAALPIVGATHSAEIPFVFGNTENLPLPNGTCSMSSTELTISKFMNEAWTSFAASQKPTTNSTAWPAYGGPSNTVGITFLNSTFPGKIDYSVCALWDRIDAMQVAATNNGSYAGAYYTGPKTNSSIRTPSRPCRRMLPGF